MGKTFRDLLAAKRQVKELEGLVTSLKNQLALARADLEVPIIPQVTKWGIPRSYFVQKLAEVGIEPINIEIDGQRLILDSLYYYTTMDDWLTIIGSLMFDSDLYKKNKFDCEDYALKAQVVCAETYGLNAFRWVVGFIPTGGHGFNIVPYGDATGIEGFMLWEPNDGFEHSGSLFNLGDFGYEAKLALV